MSNRDQERWDEVLDRELKALPDLAAPEPLLSRIMDAVRERSTRPWWRCSWQEWPPGLQAVALLVFLAAAGVVSYLGAVAVGEIQMVGLESVLGSRFEPIRDGLELWSTVWRAGMLVFKAGGQQLLLLTVLFVFGIYLVFVGVGTTWTRMWLSRT
jgi:hypothetical protein